MSERGRKPEIEEPVRRTLYFAKKDYEAWQNLAKKRNTTLSRLVAESMNKCLKAERKKNEQRTIG